MLVVFCIVTYLRADGVCVGVGMFGVVVAVVTVDNVILVITLVSDDGVGCCCRLHGCSRLQHSFSDSRTAGQISWCSLWDASKLSGVWWIITPSVSANPHSRN